MVTAALVAVACGSGPAPEAAVPATTTAGITTSTTASPAPTTTTTTAPPRPERVTLAFTGDLLPHTAVNERAAALGVASGSVFDFRPLFDQVAPRLSAADLALCHLEVPLSPDGVITGYPTFSAPVELSDAIADAGYDGCSTASNHTLDRGTPGVVTTLDRLDALGLGHAGSARTPEEALTPTLYETDAGVVVGHVAAAYGFNGYEPDEPWRVRELDPTSLVAAGRAARRAGADLVVASLHWGVEREHDVRPEQLALAEQLAASGAFDLIVGHHAHVVQPILRVNGVPVIFGLGNFLSNMTQPETSDGVIARVRAVRDPGEDRWRTDLALTPTSVDLSTFAIRPVVPSDPSWSRTMTVMTSAGVGHPQRRREPRCVTGQARRRTPISAPRSNPEGQAPALAPRSFCQRVRGWWLAQWQRSDWGTPPSTCSTCWPQPA